MIIVNITQTTHFNKFAYSFSGAGARRARRDKRGRAEGDGLAQNDASGVLVAPRSQVHGRQRPARHARVQEVVRQVEHGASHLADGVRVLADQLREGHLADLGKLGLAEAARLVAVLVPEAIAAPVVVETQMNLGNLSSGRLNQLTEENGTGCR